MSQHALVNRLRWVCLAIALAGGCGRSSSPFGDDRYAVGIEQIKNGQLTEAAATFDKLVTENPNDARAIYLRALAYDHSGQEDQALEGFTAALLLEDRILKSTPTQPVDNAIALLDHQRADAHTRRGMILKSHGKLDDAIDDFTAAILIDQKAGDAFRGRGGAFLEKGFPDVAVDDLTMALRFDPLSHEVALNRGRAYVMLDKPDEAAENCRLAIRLDPKSAVAFETLAKAYAEESKPDYARIVAGYREAMRLDKKLAKSLNAELANAYFQWALALDDEGKVADAETAFSQAAKLDATFEPQAKQYKTAHAVAAGKLPNPAGKLPPQRYEVGFRGGSSKLPPLPDPRVEKLLEEANELRQDREYDKAIDTFTQALAIDSQNADAWYGRGMAFLENGFPDTAVDDFDNAAHLMARPAEAYYQRGRAYALQGKPYIAVQDFTEAIRLNPDLAQAYYQRGLAHLESRYFDRAIADLGEAGKQDPHLADETKPLVAKAYRGLGVDQTTFGNYTAAIRDLDEAITLAPQDAKSYHARGTAYSKLGKWSLAIADYNEAINLDPGLADYELRQALKEAQKNVGGVPTK